MPIDAGTIEARIQLDIDDLIKDALTAQKAVKTMETEIKKSRAEINIAFRNETQAARSQEAALKNIALAEKTGAMAAQEAARARLDAYQKYLDVLIDVRNRIAAVNGENAKGVAAYDKLIHKQVELRDSAKQAAEAGEGFSAGITEGFKKSGAEAKKLGTHIAKSLSPALIGLLAGIKVLQGIGSALRDAFMSNEQFREGINNLKSSLGESFSAAVRPVSTFFAGLIESMAKSISQSNKLKASFKLLKEEMNSPDEFLKNQKEIEDSYEAQKTRIAELTALLAELEGNENLGYSIEYWAQLRAELDKLNAAFPETEDNYNKLIATTGSASVSAENIFKDIEKELADTEAQISLLHEKHAISDAEANQARLSALDNYINVAAKLAAEEKLTTGNIVEGLDQQIARHSELEALMESQAEQANLLNDAQTTYRATLAQIQNQEAAHFITTQEAMAQRLGAEQQYIKALSGLRDEYTKLEGPESLQAANIAALEAAHIAEAKAIQTVIDYQAEYTAETARLKADYKQISAELEHETTLAELMVDAAERRAAELEKGRDAELAALNARYDALAAQRESGGLTEEEIGHREMLTDAINQNYDALQRLAKAEAAAAARQELVERAKELRSQHQGLLQDMAGEEALQKRLVALALKQADGQKTLSELNREAAIAELNAQFALLAAQREGGELTEEEIAERERLTEAINQNYEAAKRLEKQESVTATLEDLAGLGSEIEAQHEGIIRDLAEQDIKQNGLLSDKEKELALNELAREAALAELDAQFEKLKAQREGGELTEEELALWDTLTGKVNENYDAVASGIRKAKEGVVDFKQAAKDIAQAGVSAFTSITSAVAQIAQLRAQEAMEKIDEMLQYELKAIEEAREKALVEEGFMEAQRAEDLQAQIDAAKEAGDEILQYQLERRQREMEINEEYDAQKKAAEDKARKEKAEEDFKAAKVAWSMQLAVALINLPMAVMSAIKAGWEAGSLIPVPGVAPVLAATYAGLAGAAAGAQVAAIREAEPKLKFADGGIVPGQVHGKADTVAAMVSPGEVILNRAQQEALVPQLAGDLTVEIILDGKRIGETVIEHYVNKGRILIDASRGIR